MLFRSSAYNAGTENEAAGGESVNGQRGIGYGGAVYVAGGTVTLTNDVVIENLAGRSEDTFGVTNGFGGGIFIAAGATVYIDSSTVANTVGNTDSTDTNGSTANIDGPYILLP